MNGKTNIKGRLLRLRSKHRRNMRALFPSPAEIAFIRLMGGRVITCKLICSRRTGYPIAWVWSMGALLNAEQVRREIRVGKHWVDFGNDIGRGIEIDGAAYHRDVLAAQERDQYFAGFGWMVLHVAARDIIQRPAAVRAAVQHFLTK